MKLTAFAALFAASYALAAPVGPLDGYSATSHSKYDLKRFWNDVSAMDRDMKGKDCFKRAQLWSFKLDRKYNVKTKKVFMHYTDKFNQELDDQGRSGLGARLGRLFSSNDGWDFHVAPVVNIEGTDLVLDPRMRKGPERVEEWVEYLTERGEFLLKKRQRDLLKDLRKYRRRSRKDNMTYEQIVDLRDKIKEIEGTLKYLGLTENINQKVDIKCQKIAHIMEFDRAQDNAWCFYQETSMYYYAPLELRFLNYGDIAWDQRLPVTDQSFHSERNFADGRNYVVRRWNYDQLEESLGEYRSSDRPDSLWSL